jgi:hypothetical protein
MSTELPCCHDRSHTIFVRSDRMCRQARPGDRRHQRYGEAIVRRLGRRREVATTARWPHPEGQAVGLFVQADINARAGVDKVVRDVVDDLGGVDMLKWGSGVIVHISSIQRAATAVRGDAAKAALTTYSKGCRRKLGPGHPGEFRRSGLHRDHRPEEVGRNSSPSSCLTGQPRFTGASTRSMAVRCRRSEALLTLWRRKACIAHPAVPDRPPQGGRAIGRLHFTY